MSRNRLTYTRIATTNRKRHYRSIKYPKISLSINDIYVITVIGDRLDKLAHQFYQDVRLWWVIASANRDVVKGDSWSLKGGLELRIPARSDFILDNFKEINQKNSLIFKFKKLSFKPFITIKLLATTVKNKKPSVLA